MSDHARASEADVSGHAPGANGDADGRAEQRAADRHRAAKLRQRREQAGQVRIQAWVPRERAAYARQVLHAAAVGANTLPPNPEQQDVLDATKAEAGALRAELEEAQATGDQAGREAQERTAEAAVALARAEAAERGREEAARELVVVRAKAEAAQVRERAAQEAADALRGELAGIRGRGGWRGVLLRLAGAGACSMILRS